MGQFYNFVRWPNTAWERSRKERVKKAEEDAANFEKSWNENPDIQKIRAFKEQEKLQSLKKGLMNDGEEINVIWPEEFNKAEDWLSMKMGEGGEQETTKEEKEEEDHFWFKGTLLKESEEEKEEETEGEKMFQQFLKEGKEEKKQDWLTSDNRLVKKVNGFVDLSDNQTMSDEEWADYKLSEQDKFLMKNVIKNYANISI